MLKCNIRCLCAGFLILAWLGTDVQAASVGICDIRVDQRMSVYQVMVDDKAYKGKGYLTYEDALSLRNVLRSSGICKRLAAPKNCKIKTLAAFDFGIFRDGVNFDRYARLRTLKQARDYIRALIKNKLCLPG